MTDDNLPVDIQSMQDGLFGVVITLCQTYEANGFTRPEARETAAVLLESIASTLRTLPEEHERGQ